MKNLKNISLYSIPENSRFFIKTLGCPKNEVISEKIAHLINKKYNITKNPENADYIIVNSCGFIESALSETIDTVLELSYLYKNKVKIILTGCAVQIYQKEFQKELKEADLILNYSELNNILLNENYEQPLRFKLNNKVYNYLRISEGCSQRCTYCVIPQIKGKFTPFSLNSIFKEIDYLKKENYKEIIIISQDTLSYGVSKIEKIIDYLQKSNFKWIRLMYFNPDIFDSKVLELFKFKNVLKYVELPIQHTEDSILKLMGRKSNFKKIKSIIYMFKENYPQIILRTTVITGFPGETKKDFYNMKEKLLSLPFDYIGVFPYSDMEKSTSYKFNNKVEKNEIIKRYNDLTEAVNIKSETNFKKFINNKYQFLIEKIDINNNKLIGRLYAQAPEIDGITFIKPKFNLFNLIDKYKPGNFIKVKLNDNILYDFYGEEI